MEQYVATFHTHLAALRSALYEGEGPMLSCMDTDAEAVYRREGDSFTLLHQWED